MKKCLFLVLFPLLFITCKQVQNDVENKLIILPSTKNIVIDRVDDSIFFLKPMNLYKKITVGKDKISKNQIFEYDVYFLDKNFKLDSDLDLLYSKYRSVEPLGNEKFILQALYENQKKYDFGYTYKEKFSHFKLNSIFRESYKKTEFKIFFDDINKKIVFQELFEIKDTFSLFGLSFLIFCISCTFYFFVLILTSNNDHWLYLISVFMKIVSIILLILIFIFYHAISMWNIFLFQIFMTLFSCSLKEEYEIKKWKNILYFVLFLLLAVPVYIKIKFILGFWMILIILLIFLYFTFIFRLSQIWKERFKALRSFFTMPFEKHL